MAKLGTGERFAALTKKLASRSGKTRTGKSRRIRNPRALAAAIGRKKYGRIHMTRMAAAGRTRRARTRSGR